MALACVLFDLDGTLVDTAPDLALALNRLLKQYDKQALPEETIRQVVSYGTPGLLKLGFDVDKTQSEFEKLKQQLLDLYFANICQQSCLFPGVKEVIRYLDNLGIAWGIVTNKPGWLTKALLQNFPEVNAVNCVISGDTLNRAKPHPEPLLHACKQIQVATEHSLYIGDAEIDVLAARAANMPVIIAEYGYSGIDVNPYEWQADAYIKQPLDLLSLIDDRIV